LNEDPKSSENEVMNERTIFVEALERGSPAERAAYLEQACGGNATLRARLERLLKSHEGAGGFLEQPPAGLVATIAGADPDTSPELADGDPLSFLAPSDKPGCLGTLGQYEVVEVVGRGGMGIVLRAYDTKLNRIVAIKVIAPELTTNPMAVKRFLREAQAAAAVSHDHVVTIHAIHDEHRPPYIVMEFIQGPSLQEKIDQTGALEPTEILRIGLQSASALAAAHAQGLVHRDIKPANILLENGVERVKITDFGLARAVDDVSMTQPGLVTGTPQYMSPEQAQGHVIDHRSDLFSLGSVLYAMCTGRPPFQADTSLAMLRRVAEDHPPPVRGINPEIPDWLEEIVVKLMAKDPDQRFGSAREVAEVLGQWLSHLQNPRIHKPPVRRRIKQFLPQLVPAKAVSPKSTWFGVLLVTHLLCMAAFAVALCIDVHLVVPAGPICSFLGLAVAIVGWRQARSILGVALGLSTVIFSLLVTLGINLLEVGPAEAQDPVSWLVLAYLALAIPLGVTALLNAYIAPAQRRWPIAVQFNLRSMLVLVALVACLFAGVRLSLGVRPNSAVALATGGLIATAFALAWAILHIVRQNTVLHPRKPHVGRSQDLLPQLGWIIGAMLVGILGLVLAAGLALWHFDRTNYGIVVFDSPVSDLQIERLRNGRVERTYDTLHGGGTRWHVPVGVWQFRIQGGQAEYRLAQDQVRVERGSFTTIRIVPVAPEPTPAESPAWDKLVQIATDELEATRTRFEAGVVSTADLHAAQVGLLEAQIERARMQDDRSEVVRLLEELIKVREAEVKSIRDLFEVGRVPPSSVHAALKGLAQAQASLEEARQHPE